MPQKPVIMGFLGFVYRLALISGAAKNRCPSKTTLALIYPRLRFVLCCVHIWRCVHFGRWVCSLSLTIECIMRYSITQRKALHTLLCMGSNASFDFAAWIIAPVIQRPLLLRTHRFQRIPLDNHVSACYGSYGFIANRYFNKLVRLPFKCLHHTLVAAFARFGVCGIDVITLTDCFNDYIAG